MAHQRAWNLRYLALKLAAGAEEAVASLSSATSTLPQAVIKGIEAYKGQLTYPIVITGVAMHPTLNSAAAAQPHSLENLLVRLIPRPVAHKTIFDGDVVAFNSPIAGPASSPVVMVRRVAALEGVEMVSDGAEDEAFAVPEGHCWVLADNEALPFQEAPDSRTFGPLPLDRIMGRIMYCARDETDHGPVENSEEGMAADAAVLEAELDLDKLCGGGGPEESQL